jgi:predicted Zn-ribbon and HTH transcriptional regulator
VTELLADHKGRRIPTVRAYCADCRFTWRTPAPVDTGPYAVRCPDCQHVVIIHSAG